jgi:hypothetical protein
MPVFTRRRLQAMLNDLAERVDTTKVRDLVGRLEAKDAEQVLPAEMELALLWVLSRLALLWQMLSGAGFPNRVLRDSWVVG